MFELDWQYIDGVGYVRQEDILINNLLSEGYIIDGIKGVLKKDQPITDIRYIEEYPNLRLARLLGHKWLTGNNWKNSPYQKSYYFDIRMKIMTPEMKYNTVWGSLRISDHRVNPYAFGENAKYWNKFGNKKYAFGISIVFPLNSTDKSGKLKPGYEAHVFEHIFMSSGGVKEKSLIDNLKNGLEKCVTSLKSVITVGTNAEISPSFYKEVTNGNLLFNDTQIQSIKKEVPSDSDTEIWHDKKTKKSPAEDPLLKKFNNREKTQFEKYNGAVLADVISETGMEPIPIYVTKKGKGNSIPYLKINDGDTLYPTRQYRGLLMPCMPENPNRLVKLPTGIYIWKNWMGNDMAAAIVDGFETVTLKLRPTPKRGRPKKTIDQIVSESINRFFIKQI